MLLNAVSKSLLGSMRLQLSVWLHSALPCPSSASCLTSVSTNSSVTESPMCHLINTGLWLVTGSEYWPLIGWHQPLPHCTSPVSATVKAIRDRVVIRDTQPDIMWYTHSGGTWPKDTDYILILHIFRICSAALIFAPAQFFVGLCQQLLELSWGGGLSQPWNIWTQYLSPSTCHDTDPGGCKESSLTIRFPKSCTLGWPENEWVLYDHHYLYNYIKF